MKRLLISVAVCFAVTSVAYATKIVRDEETDVTTYHYVYNMTTGEPNTSPTVVNFDLYAIEEGGTMTAKVDCTALGSADAAHSDNKGYAVGRNLVRIDWPDSLFDGGPGKTVHLIVVQENGDDWITPGEVQLQPSVDVNSVRRADPLQGTDFQSSCAAALAADTGSHLTAIAWNPDWDAEVQSEADDAIVANYLDYFFKTTYDPASKPGAADALLNELVESDAGVTRFTENSLEQGPGGGAGVTVSEFTGSALVEIRKGGFRR